MAVDFKKHLSTQLDDVKRPPPLPGGTYYGTIQKYEFGESPEKKTPYVRFHVVLTGPGDDVDPAELEGIDLPKRTPRRDYYLTDDAIYRLKELLESCKIPTAGRTLEEALPDTLNQQVICTMVQTPNKKSPSDPPYTEITQIVGQ